MHVMVIADIGATHSTGNHLCRALEANSHIVYRVDEKGCWPDLEAMKWVKMPDFVIWNSTPGYAPDYTYDLQYGFLNNCEARGIPVVGYHLDLFWSIPERERWVTERPFFRSDLVVTADGGHDERWEEAGVNHVWFPPAVLAAECVPGTYREEYAADVAFVGSWVPGVYHRRSKHRAELVMHLKTKWGSQTRFWPEHGEPAIRGADLRDLYASTKVVVGDSCNVPHLKNYWSDRVPETTGRGAFLLHPTVGGLATKHPHLATWPAGDWSELDHMISGFLENEEHRERRRKLNREDTLLNHTYEIRVRQLVELLQERGML